MSHKENLKVIEYAKKELNRFFKDYGFSPDEIKQFCSDGTNYRWKSFDYDGAPDVFRMLSKGNGGDAIRPVVECGRSFLKIIQCDKGSKPYVEKRAVSYKDTFDVEIPISWGKAVYSESIATVKAGDGERFVLRAKKKNLTRLSKQGIVAYACETLKVYRGEATIENAWVLKYEAPDDTILATHTEFSRAESLLNRRIKDTVVKELVDF